MTRGLFSLLLWVALIATIQLYAQPAITFDSTTHDYGNIAEEDGLVSCQMSFTNTGNEALLILYADASCGCTTPMFPKAPIAAGDTSSVTITYNATGRPGAFSKKIHLYTNTPETKTELTIKGRVIPDGNASINQYYPYTIGNLRLRSLHIPYFSIASGQIKSEVIEIYNKGEQSITPTIAAVPKHLTVSFAPTSIPPQQRGEMVVTYDGRKLSDWGMQRDSFLLKTGTESHPITLMAELGENFSDLTPQELAKAPRIHLNRGLVRFGNIELGQTAVQTVTITNGGESDLVIRKIDQTTPQIVATTAQVKIAPKGSTTLTIQINSQKLPPKKIDQRIHIITNDPKSPTSVVRILGEVK